jgi:hypothetical protein
MVRHILLLEPRPDTTAENIEECRVALQGLVGKIPGLLDCHWGENFAASERREGFTHGFTMDFLDRQSLEAYAPHPEHAPVAALVRAAFRKITVLDITL